MQLCRHLLQVITLCILHQMLQYDDLCLCILNVQCSTIDRLVTRNQVRATWRWRHQIIDCDSTALNIERPLCLVGHDGMEVLTILSAWWLLLRTWECWLLLVSLNISLCRWPIINDHQLTLLDAFSVLSRASPFSIILLYGHDLPLTLIHFLNYTLITLLLLLL